MFAALDNGFLAVDDSKELQRICNRLSGAKIDALLRKWLAVLPQPFTAADRRAGYRCQGLAAAGRVLPEQVLDRSESGRIFLKQVTVTTSTGAGPSHGLWSRCPAGALVPQAYSLRRHIGDPDR